ncbi:MAG: GNAT family N-acetyltransferase [Caldilineaceae bacterium]|nr:GNAT family N-acetyltransferase [Caldilineaceae bacterium]
MIRPLAEEDRAQTVALLQRAAAQNLYALGNLDAHGFGADFCQFWGSFGDGGELQAVLNRYMAGWVVYGASNADWVGLGNVVDRHPIGAERLQDNPGGVGSFLPYLRRYRARIVEEEELMILDPADFRPDERKIAATVCRATLADLPALVALYADAGDMSRSPAAVERPLRERRMWVAVVEGEICAAALTNAEIKDAAMIGGVFTRPDMRGKGLSQAVVSAISAELLALGKTPTLYWVNPVAGAIYHKLGFHPVGTWRAVRLEKMIG